MPESTWGAWSQPKRHRELPVQSPALHHSVLQLRLWWTTPIPWRSWLAKAPAYELSVKMCKVVVCSEKAFKADLQRTSWISNIFMYILSNTLVYILLIDTIQVWLLWMGYLHIKTLTTPLLSFGFYFFCLDSAGSSGWSVPCSVDLATLYWSQPPPALTRLKTGISLVWVISGELLAHLNEQYRYNSIYLRIPIVDSSCCWKFFSATLNSCNFLGFSPENNQDCPWQWCHQKPGWQENTNPALPAHLFISQINQQPRSHPTNLI